MIEAYLTGHTQVVPVGCSEKSLVVLVECEVQQGSILGPLVFLVYAYVLNIPVGLLRV